MFPHFTSLNVKHNTLNSYCSLGNNHPTSVISSEIIIYSTHCENKSFLLSPKLASQFFLNYLREEWQARLIVLSIITFHFKSDFFCFNGSNETSRSSQSSYTLHYQLSNLQQTRSRPTRSIKQNISKVTDLTSKIRDQQRILCVYECESSKILPT